MVEGPGATRNGKKIASAFDRVGRGGNVQMVKQCLSITSKESSSFHSIHDKLVGLVYKQVFSVGKEVFIIFERHSMQSESDDTNSCKDIALRLHFGMNGTLVCASNERVLNSKLPPWKRDHRSAEGSSITRLEFCPISNNMGLGKETSMIIESRSTSVSLVPAKIARSKFLRLSTFDACGPCFDQKAVVDRILEKAVRMNISDALLNQDIYPGVGNIIKIEGLHRASIDPRDQVCLIPKDLISKVVDECRSFSMNWLQYGKAGEKKVYNRTECGSCGGDISMQKVGGHSGGLSRVTFWCKDCQPSITAEYEPNVHRPKRKIDSSSFVVLSCPQHGMTNIKLRRVRKEKNRDRLFAICSAPQCPYFKWADQHLPFCKCGEKVIMRISKTSNSGGKWFLCCSRNGIKGNNTISPKLGCDYFSWVTGPQKLPFGKLLTPLL